MLHRFPTIFYKLPKLLGLIIISEHFLSMSAVVCKKREYACLVTETRTLYSVDFLSLQKRTNFVSFQGDLGASAILGNLSYSKYLGKLISYLDPVVPDAFRSEFVRCWHAKTDGSAASTFHSNCDGKGPTVTIIQSGSYIFGGYTDLSWQSKYS